MASTSPRSWTSTAIAIVAVAATACIDWVILTWHRATSWLADLTVACARAMPRLQHEWPDVTALQVPLVRARAFVERILHRDAPRLTPGWRLCPSI